MTTEFSAERYTSLVSLHYVQNLISTRDFKENVICRLSKIRGKRYTLALPHVKYRRTYVSVLRNGCDYNILGRKETTRSKYTWTNNAFLIILILYGRAMMELLCMPDVPFHTVLHPRPWHSTSPLKIHSKWCTVRPLRTAPPTANRLTNNA